MRECTCPGPEDGIAVRYCCAVHCERCAAVAESADAIDAAIGRMEGGAMISRTTASKAERDAVKCGDGVVAECWTCRNRCNGRGCRYCKIGATLYGDKVHAVVVNQYADSHRAAGHDVRPVARKAETD